MAEVPVSVDSTFKMAVQASKGTAASSGFLTGRLKQSSLVPAFDEMNPGAEHSGSDGGRPTIQKTHSHRTGYVGAFSASWFLYPEFIGPVLRGLGFEDAVSGIGPNYNHVFTIANRDNAPYVTVIKSIGSGAEAFERLGEDGRIAALRLMASIKGILCSMQGTTLNIGNSVGTETGTNEDAAGIASSSGALSCQVSSVDLVTKIRTAMVDISNPIYVQDVNLFTPKRESLPQMGVALRGAFGGIDLDSTLWNKLYRNGSSSGVPSLIIPEADITFTFESIENITGAAVPYSLTFDLPTCEIRMTPHGSSGRNLIRVGLEWVMVDAASAVEPVTITLVNDISSAY